LKIKETRKKILNVKAAAYGPPESQYRLAGCERFHESVMGFILPGSGCAGFYIAFHQHVPK
jgi:hypothetical protein